MARSTQHQWHSFARPSSRPPGQRRPIKRQPFQRRLRIEPLEDRRLLAVVTVTHAGRHGRFQRRRDVAAGGDLRHQSGRRARTRSSLPPSLTSGGPATITLTQGELKITDSLTINGPGANLLTIDASGNDPTPDDEQRRRQPGVQHRRRQLRRTCSTFRSAA